MAVPTLLPQYRCPLCHNDKPASVEQIGETFSDFDRKPPIVGWIKHRCLSCDVVFMGEYGEKPWLMVPLPSDSDLIIPRPNQ